MAQTNDETQSRWIPPYIVFRTITDLIGRMVEEEPPARIDKSYLHRFSGGYQTQVIAALNSLGLRDEGTGEVTKKLQALVSATDDERRALLADLIREHYMPLLTLGANATQQQMLDAFKAMGVNSGDTMRKSVAFFLNGANYAGITVSRHWRTPRVPPSTRRKTSGVNGDTRTPAGAGVAGQTPEPIDTGQPANVRSVTLRSGGTVMLSVSVDLFSLSEEDRKFTLELVDKMRDYENQKALPPASSAESVEGGEEEEDEAGIAWTEDSREPF